MKPPRARAAPPPAPLPPELQRIIRALARVLEEEDYLASQPAKPADGKAT